MAQRQWHISLQILFKFKSKQSNFNFWKWSFSFTLEKIGCLFALGRFDLNALTGLYDLVFLFCFQSTLFRHFESADSTPGPNTLYSRYSLFLLTS